MDLENHKYFIYIRKSSEDKDRQMLSIPAQLEELAKVVDRYNLTVVDTIIDSKSAFIPYNRPAFTKMLKRIDKGEASGIICWRINRLSRNHIENATIQWQLQTNKLAAIVTPHRIYRTDDNAIFYGIEAVEAVQYSRDLSVHIKRGLNQKVAMGWPPGMAPLGYLNTKLNNRGANTIIPDPERWPIIRKAFDLLLTGAYTAPKIVDILNNEYGLRTRFAKVKGNKPISRSTIYQIFTDSFYYGYFMRNGQQYKGAYQPMITIDEFDEVQQILGRKGKPRPKKHIFTFTGLMKCGVCGASITACRKVKRVISTGKLKTYCLYHCTKRKAGIKCNTKCYIPEDEIEDLIIKELLMYDIRPSFKKWGLTILQEDYGSEVEKRMQLLSIQEKAETQIQKELDQLLELRISCDISPEIYKEKKIEKETRLIRIQETRKLLEKRAVNWIHDLEDKLDFLVNVIQRFNNGDLNTRKEICHRFGWNWTLKDRKLLIDKQEWVESIRKYKEGVEAKFGRLEPEKAFLEKGEKASYALLRPLLCSLAHEVRTQPPDNNTIPP